MNSLKKYPNDAIIEMIMKGTVTAADLTDSGICPTCFDRENGHVLYGDNEDMVFYEDERFECFLVGNPRADGHAAISTKKHYKDMPETEDDLCAAIFVLSKKVMLALKEIYGAESVYLCTMCDGPMNHFHVQLIPRYAHEKRGSKNFVKPRFEYRHDPEKVRLLREKLTRA